MRLRARRRWEELREAWPRGAFAPGQRIAVLAAHPDDESIGASFLLSHCSEPRVIYLTDGAPRNTTLWPPDFRGSREDYARCRRAEAGAALAHAGVSPRRIEWLGGIDQEAIFGIARMTEGLTTLLAKDQIDVLVTHPYEGGHPDHDAAALIASLAISRLAHECLLLEMTSYHASGERCVNGTFLNPDRSRECAFELSATDQARKQAMFDAQVSQKLVLGSFPLDRERLRLAPDYDFTAPPHEGRLWYEILGWEMTGKRWRELAADALAGNGEVHAAHRA